MTIATERKKADYTEGSVFGSIMKMGLPSMFGFISQNIYALADTFWVSQLPGSEAGVAAITFFGTILWLFYSFNSLVGYGSVAFISRRYGEKEYDLAEKTIKETLVLKLFLGTTFGILGFVLADKMLIWMGAETEVLEAGLSYGRVMFLGMGISYACYSIYTAMRGVANPQMAMILMIASNLLNVVLDPLLMFGWFGLPAWGIKGAAIASVASYAITLIVGMYLLGSGRTNVKLHLRGKYPMDIASMWKLVRVGIPAWLGELSFSSSRVLMTPMIAAFGTSVVAAYGVGNQITHFGMAVLVGISLGLSALIGHNVGGGKLERAKKTADSAVLLGTSIMTVFGIVVFVFAGELVGTFFKSAETIAHGAVMLRIYAISFPFLGAFMMMEGVHTGVGLNTPRMITDIVLSFALQVAPIFILTQVMGFDQTAIWWTVSISMALSTTAFFMYYQRGRWLTVKL